MPDALRPIEAQSVSSPAPAATVHRFAHRADAGSGAAGDVLTKLTVVLLSSVNAVMWEVYTESRLMAVVWAVIAIAVVVWMKRDAARR